MSVISETCGPVNVQTWLDENKSSFRPPVCNKVMSNGQLKIMFIGGPNLRRDYHIEAGEELFYMYEGDMCLKVMEKGIPKDIIIKQGEIFVLPRRVPHSPQRNKDTVGLVIERDRLEHETDGLRYYCEDNVTILYESWFHCVDLVKDLPPVIQEYVASEQFKSGKPIPGTITDNPPTKPDVETELAKPVNLKKWIEERKSQLYPQGQASFYEAGEFKVLVCGGGDFKHHNKGETWLWQLEGHAEVKIGDSTKSLSANDCYIVPCDTGFSVKRDENSIGLVIRMNPMK